MTASDCAVLIAAAGVLPASQRAACPTNPCPSVPDTPGSGVPLVVGVVVVAVVVVGVVVVDGETVSVCVVTDGGGPAMVVGGGVAVSWRPLNSCIASTTATANSRIVATTSATWLVLYRDLRATGSAVGIAGGGYGV